MTSGREQIQFRISKDGSSIKVETSGYQGQSCAAGPMDIARSLGDVVSFTPKAEYYNNQLDNDVVTNVT